MACVTALLAFVLGATFKVEIGATYSGTISPRRSLCIGPNNDNLRLSVAYSAGGSESVCGAASVECLTEVTI